MNYQEYSEHVINLFERDQLKKGYPMDYIMDAIESMELNEIEQYLLRFDYKLNLV